MAKLNYDTMGFYKLIKEISNEESSKNWWETPFYRKQIQHVPFSFSGPEIYDGSCVTIIKNKMLKRVKPNNELESIGAIFAPATLKTEHLASREKYVWDYDLTIAGTIKPMTLIWVKELVGKLWDDDNYVVAFSFLQPNFLKYLLKRFTNDDAITQVNLLLDYHRTQKRKKGIEVFTLFDLVAFKMAIDDNRVKYYNCEFHKIIERTLREAIQSGKYMAGANFDLNYYMSVQMDYRREYPFVDYLLYHFHETICSIYWSARDKYPIKISDITDTPNFLKALDKSFEISGSETNPTGKYSRVLYEILSKATADQTFKFNLDDEWIYSALDLFNESDKQNLNHKFIINTKNSFNFIENFINWLKLSFDEQTKHFDLKIECDNFPTIKSYIFNGLHVNTLAIDGVTLDYKLCRALNMCRYKSIRFQNCKIQNDNNERFEFNRCGPVTGGSIFKFLNLLPDVYILELNLEEHTIGMLFTYVASVMMGENLTSLRLHTPIFIKKFQFVMCHFKRFDPNTDFDRIEANRDMDWMDIYEAINNIKASVREEFDFYN